MMDKIIKNKMKIILAISIILNLFLGFYFLSSESRYCLYELDKGEELTFFSYTASVMNSCLKNEGIPIFTFENNHGVIKCDHEVYNYIKENSEVLN